MALLVLETEVQLARRSLRATTAAKAPTGSSVPDRRHTKVAQTARRSNGAHRPRDCAHTQTTLCSLCCGSHGVASLRCSGCFVGFVGFVVMPDSASVLGQPATTPGQHVHRPTGVRSTEYGYTAQVPAGGCYVLPGRPCFGPRPCAGEPLTDGRLQEQHTGMRASQECEHLFLNGANLASLPACQVSSQPCTTSSPCFSIPPAGGAQPAVRITKHLAAVANCDVGTCKCSSNFARLPSAGWSELRNQYGVSGKGLFRHDHHHLTILCIASSCSILSIIGGRSDSPRPQTACRVPIPQG